MAKVSNGVETLPKISIAWVGRTNVTDDRQTDRQTDGRAMTYSERERELMFAKNLRECLKTAHITAHHRTSHRTSPHINRTSPEIKI